MMRRRSYLVRRRSRALWMMRSTSKLLLQAALHQYEEEHTQTGENFTYTCDLDLLPGELSSCFVELQPDDETHAFLEESQRRSSSVCLQLFYTCMYIILGLFLSQTSINGLLERGRMFVLSKRQLSRLIPHSILPQTPPLLLDIGSGDGHVTDNLRQALGCTSVHVTEASIVMQRVLRKKGFSVMDVDKWSNSQQPRPYDIISCLNVLDRCDAPLSMLRQIHNRLTNGGILLLALVLPYDPFVEQGFIKVTPSEYLPILSRSWEEGVAKLWTKVLQPMGFEPLAVARVPYLCEGDLHVDYYSLDDVILVLRKHENT